MGAWGHGSFENDGALDWLGELVDDGADAAYLVKYIDSSLSADADDLGGEEIIAAVEMVAALRGYPNADLSEEAADWAITHQADVNLGQLVPKALKLVERVRLESPLPEAWEEGADPELWIAALDELEERLRK